MIEPTAGWFACHQKNVNNKPQHGMSMSVLDDSPSSTTAANDSESPFLPHSSRIVSSIVQRHSFTLTMRDKKEEMGGGYYNNNNNNNNNNNIMIMTKVLHWISLQHMTSHYTYSVLTDLTDCNKPGPIRRHQFPSNQAHRCYNRSLQLQHTIHRKHSLRTSATLSIIGVDRLPAHLQKNLSGKTRQTVVFQNLVTLITIFKKSISNNKL